MGRTSIGQKERFVNNVETACAFSTIPFPYGPSPVERTALGTPDKKAPDPKHPLEDIDAALQAEGLQMVGMDENRSVLVGFSVGNKLVYVIQGYLKNPLVKQVL